MLDAKKVKPEQTESELEKEREEYERKTAELEKERVELERKNAELEKKIAAQDREIAELEKEHSELERKEEEIMERVAQDDALWSTELGKKRHMPTRAARFLYAVEVLDDIISSPDKLYTFTRTSKELFDDTLADLQQKIKESNNMSHFRADHDSSDFEGQYKLYVRHFLLLSMIHRSHGATNSTFGLFLGIGYDTVCKYLQLAISYDDKIYPTPNNITKHIATVKTEKELKEIMPGRDRGEFTLDGILIETIHPQTNTEHKKQYEKNEGFIINTAVMINKHRYIIGISDSQEARYHDPEVMAKGMIEFRKWADSMTSGENLPKARSIRLGADGGYMGIDDYFLGIVADKNPKDYELSAIKKAQNKAHSSKRISVEHVFAYVKNWKIIYGIYEDTVKEFNAEFNGVCGLYNKRKMWQDGTYHHWKKKVMI